VFSGTFKETLDFANIELEKSCDYVRPYKPCTPASLKSMLIVEAQVIEMILPKCW
jgi:hypothetical protein